MQHEVQRKFRQHRKQTNTIEDTDSDLNELLNNEDDFEM